MEWGNQIVRQIGKAIVYCLILTGMLACGGGGGGDDPLSPPDPDPTPQVKLEINPDKVAAGAAGGTYTVNVTASTDWSAVCDSAWCSTSGTDGVLTLKVVSNPYKKERQTSVRIGMSGLKRTVTVTQAAAELPEEQLDVEREELEVVYRAGEYVLGVTANVGWTVKSDKTWCTATREGEKLKIVVTLNEGKLERPAQLTVTGGKIVRTVRVTQAGITVRGQDSLALVAIFATTGGDSWKEKWDTSQDISRWTGVKLDASGKRVVELRLRANQLAGNFPAAVVKLSGLKKLDLGDNSLKGSLPVSIGDLEDLEYLALDSCGLSGSLPDGLWQLTGLRILDLGYNTFVGNLPEGLSALTRLAWLRLAGNQLGGSLPESWKALRTLVVLDVSGNSVEGNIPGAWFAALLKTEYLYLHGNRLGGEIPEAIINLYSLRSLALDNNDLTGSIPDDLADLPGLVGLWLYNNRLSGQIPVSLSHHSRWPEWQAYVCPQRGEGFAGGCSPVGRSAVYSDVYPLPDKNRF